MVACASTTATVIGTLTLRPDAARRAASGLLLATEVADYLVGRGLPFRTAHEISGRIARDLYESGRDFSALSLDDWQRYHELFDDGIFEAITPEAAVAAQTDAAVDQPARRGRRAGRGSHLARTFRASVASVVTGRFESVRGWNERNAAQARTRRSCYYPHGFDASDRPRDRPGGPVCTATGRRGIVRA